MLENRKFYINEYENVVIIINFMIILKSIIAVISAIRLTRSYKKL